MQITTNIVLPNQAAFDALTIEEKFNMSLYILEDTQTIYTFIDGVATRLTLPLEELKKKLKLRRIVATVNDLPDDPFYGDLYLVGTEHPYYEYYYSETIGDWEVLGITVEIPNTFIDSIDIDEENDSIIMTHSIETEGITVPIPRRVAKTDLTGLVKPNDQHFVFNDGKLGLPIQIADRPMRVGQNGDLNWHVLYLQDGDLSSADIGYTQNAGTSRTLICRLGSTPQAAAHAYDLRTFLSNMVWLGFGSDGRDISLSNISVSDAQITFDDGTTWYDITTTSPHQENFGTKYIDVGIKYWKIVLKDANKPLVPVEADCIPQVKFTLTTHIPIHNIHATGYLKTALAVYSYDDAVNKPTIDGTEIIGDMTSLDFLMYTPTQTVRDYLDSIHEHSYDMGSIVYVHEQKEPVLSLNHSKWKLDGRQMTSASDYNNPLLPASWRLKRYFPKVTKTYNTGDPSDSISTLVHQGWYLVRNA